MSTEAIQRRRHYTTKLAPYFALLMVFAVGCSEQKSQAPEQSKVTETPAPEAAQPEPAQPASEPEPVAKAPEPAAAAPDTQTAAVDGEAVYQKACKTCHDAGIANAPKLGDKDAWAPRIAKGNDAMFESVKNGLNAMPPKGACMSCSEDELRSAMEYMVSM